MRGGCCCGMWDWGLRMKDDEEGWFLFFVGRGEEELPLFPFSTR